jgi:L-alanine-DL-glutamate epimerase-like enolase superfamily enzyme
LPDKEGLLEIPDAPGLGISVDTEAIGKYLVEAEIVVGGRSIYRTPRLA